MRKLTLVLFAIATLGFSVTHAQPAVGPDLNQADWLPVLLAPSRPVTAEELRGAGTDAKEWTNPLIKQGKLDTPLVEVTPFVFKGKRYLLENWQKQWETPGVPEGTSFQQDEVRIRDLETGEIVSIALEGHGLGMALVWEDRVYVFAGDWGTEKKWQIKAIEMTSSADLKNWTTPEVVLRANDDENYFNVSVCRGRDAFVMLVESNDPLWPAFTFKYFTSQDLKTWTPVENAIYGREKYVGGPALYNFGDYFYTLFLQSLGEGFYETRVARSRDLVHWQDAPEDRPVVTYDPAQKVHPVRMEDLTETNASDVEIYEWEGKTYAYFTGGDQHVCGDLQLAVYDGSPQLLLEHYFAEPDLPKPTANQLAYQEAQLGAFVHFGPATFANGDFMTVPSPDVFNPAELNCDQWMETAVAMGAKHIVLTAKHHNGYCLWPTKTTDYSVRSSPWKNGAGDVVREFVDAARRHGLKPGLYVSGGDKHFPCASTPQPIGERVVEGDRNAYFPIYLEQLRELLTNYGELCMLWFDGAYDPFGWDVRNAQGKFLGPAFGDAIALMVHELQPTAVIFNGTRPDIRWSGSERGQSTYPLWNVVTPENATELWCPVYTNGYVLAEAVLHTRSTWFWQPGNDNTLLTVNDLVEIAYSSLGNGANLLINLTPDSRGLIPDAEVDRMRAFGEAWGQLYSSPVATTNSEDKWEEGNVLTLRLPAESAVNRIMLEEDLRFGQRIQSYRIEAKSGEGWQTIIEGQSVGRMRIERFESITTTGIRLRVTHTLPLPKIRRFAAFRP